jgi:hypothetical protein
MSSGYKDLRMKFFSISLDKDNLNDDDDDNDGGDDDPLMVIASYHSND